MSWRSSYLFCPKCGSVYFANQIAPVVNIGSMHQYCPNALCDSPIELVSIDELMIRPIVELNKKGYRTAYCCSGHDLRGSYDQHGYILFTPGINLENAPSGWNLERDNINNRVCIRSQTDDIAASISLLNEWIEGLENYNKD